jgi:general secretion pathway protein A
MYNDHYGLSGRPFQLTPDPRFYFESGTHRKAMAYLGYGLAQGEGFIVITGEIGSGKTTLTGHLLNTVDPMRIKAIRLVSTQLNGDELLSSVATNFGVQTQGVDKAGLLDGIESRLLEFARSGQKALIIVDEAQNLDMSALEELRMLSNFQAGEHAMVQLLLLGQPEFKERLDSDPALEQLRQRVIATHHLTAMERSEVRPYIEHRMQLVGWQGNPRLDESAIEPIFAYSGGMPRKINNLMTRVLLMGSMEQRAAVDGQLVDVVVADMDRDGTAVEAPAPQTEQPMAPASTVHDPVALDFAARIAMLESHAEEQGAVLRRVLTLLVQWAESNEPRPTSEFFRAPVA